MPSIRGRARQIDENATGRLGTAWTGPRIMQTNHTRERPLQVPFRTFLGALFGMAVAAAHPDNCVAPRLPAPPAAGRLVILAAGKAAGAMAEVAERHYVDDRRLPADRVGGLAVTRHGYGRPIRSLRLIEAGHPVPDAAGLAATLETLALADS